ncbi:MAG: hypothetical protein H0V89_02510, partial [Deltaproteobacteria bacterium]|nr:hypothetical protein [Deltaproteobacteria bacterium]
MQGRGRAWAAMVAVGAISVVAAAATSALPSSPGHAVVDDAWISWRYAEHLAEGRGLVYNTGAPPIEGYTNL